MNRQMGKKYSMNCQNEKKYMDRKIDRQIAQECLFRYQEDVDADVGGVADFDKVINKLKVRKNCNMELSVHQYFFKLYFIIIL